MPRCPQDLSFSRFKPFYKTICIILKRSHRASSVPACPRVSYTRLSHTEGLPWGLPGSGHCCPSGSRPFSPPSPCGPFPALDGAGRDPSLTPPHLRPPLPLQISTPDTPREPGAALPPVPELRGERIGPEAVAPAAEVKAARQVLARASPFGQHRQRLPAAFDPRSTRMRTGQRGAAQAEGASGVPRRWGGSGTRPQAGTRSPRVLPLPTAPAGGSHTIHGSHTTTSFAPHHSPSYPSSRCHPSHQPHRSPGQSRCCRSCPPAGTALCSDSPTGVFGRHIKERWKKLLPARLYHSP